MAGICMKFIEYIKDFINKTSFTQGVKDVYRLLNHTIIDLNRHFNVGTKLEEVFTIYGNPEDAEIKIREAFEILHGDILYSPIPNEQRLRANTRNIFEKFYIQMDLVINLVINLVEYIFYIYMVV